MNYLLCIPGMPFNGETISSGQSLGGSESAAYYLAKELADRGHGVTVFSNITNEMAGQWDGVRYIPLGNVVDHAPLGEIFHQYATTTPHDVLIIQRREGAFNVQYASKINFSWTHDLALKRTMHATQSQLWNIDKIFAVSEWHKQQIIGVHGVAERSVDVVPNGVDPELFCGKIDTQAKKDGLTMIYTSRPERGLENLLRVGGIMEKLAESNPEIKLKIAGYDNTIPEMAGFYEGLYRRAEELPNVENMGHLSKADLAKEMQSAWLHIYPTAFEETSCITAMEAQTAGNPFITTSIGALPETLKGGGVKFVKNLDNGGVDIEGFVSVIKSLKDNPAKWDGLRSLATEKAKAYRWGLSADRVEKAVESVLVIADNPTAKAAHYLRYSDIIPMDLSGERESNPIIDGVAKEVEKNYGFAKSQESMVKHYNKFYAKQKKAGIKYGYVDWGTVPRFQAIRQYVERLPAGTRVLDYGCECGHITMTLAKEFPEIDFVGADIVDANLSIGRKWAKDDKVDNVSFCNINDIEGDYDLIVIAEVLEHLVKPLELIERLTGHLVENGTFVISSPYGPMEARNYNKPDQDRGHIWHFERQDLFEMFGHHPGYEISQVYFHPTEEGIPLGSYILAFEKPVTPNGQINLSRKYREAVGMQTLSVCMIARPDGDVIGKALKSIRGIANEIIIGVDCGVDGIPNHKDPIWDIAKRYGAVAFPMVTPLETGFDEARNSTVERACGDWILWIDDDEELQHPENVCKYLRNNGLDAYAIPQHHFSTEPAGLLKTDYPSRLFRRVIPGSSDKIKFFGLVHEHPEKSLNGGIGGVFKPSDFCISHNGYTTEAIRRERFKRNLPLMIRDREKYPDRTLCHFLWIRDLSHMNRYEFATARGVTQAIHDRCIEAIGLWRELVKSGNVRMATDALPYYSEVVDALTRGRGIEWSVSLGVNMGGLGNMNGQPPAPIMGKFACREDIEAFTALHMRENLSITEGKYI